MWLPSYWFVADTRDNGIRLIITAAEAISRSSCSRTAIRLVRSPGCA
ncbi:MAG: hypothetical protein LLG44_13460 [Chloroflexi bacterium]|nr:hypothetical protein [Chloroflexota bacterium]